MKKTMFSLLSAIFLWLATCCVVTAQVDDHNPVGAMGTFEGVVTTGCAYNVINHSTQRAIDDIVVPGSIGKYPLKMTRYYVSRDFGDSRMGPGWRHEYSWSSGQGKVEYPNGNVWDNSCKDPVGVSDDWEVPGQMFRLADGGRVVFDGYGRASQIIDPYGHTTTITYVSNTMQVTEPGGRYLLFTYNGPQGLLSKVEAYDGVPGHPPFDSVNYTYTSEPTGGHWPSATSAMCLTSAAYSDGTSATYIYEYDNVPDQPTRNSFRSYPLVSTCNDVRYHSGMRRIAYDYQNNGPHGGITAERYSPSDGVKGLAVSSIPGNLPSPLSGGEPFYFPTDFTETRGDGPSRAFHYSSLHMHRLDNVRCPDIIGTAPSQFLLSYTDFTNFQGHTTQLGYDAHWYVHTVTDANNYTTTYDHNPNPNGIGEITKITHPDGTHIDYTYYDEDPQHIGIVSGHYLQSVTDERGAYLCDPAHTTTYTRDANYRVTRIEYPHDASTPVSVEEFAYDHNNLGLVSTHHLRNGAYQHFQYDGRGLLLAKTNPTDIADWQTAINTAPKTTYSYYTSGPWTDRVQTMTLPANVSGLRASETYQYDTVGGNPVAGRGLVTQITHADGKYQSFGYDSYGNKLWEENELRKRTSYTYDDYNRVLTIKDPIGQTTGRTTTYTYGTSPYLHTTNNPDTVTTPTGITTSNVYDENFRKTSSTVAGQATWFHYDPVGNQDWVTDPRGTANRTYPIDDPTYRTTTDYDSRNRKSQVREPLSRTTQFYYEDGINVTRIVRPDTTSDWKTYDALNRMTAETVPQTASIYLNTYFDYNPSGTIQKVTDPNGHHTWFYYDASDQKTQMTYDDGISTQHWAYDDAHNLASRTTVGGKTQSFTFDNRNRKTGMSWSNGVDSASFTYYDDGRLLTASNANSTVTRQYDAAGHLTLDRQNIAGFGIKNVNYPTYDDDGSLTRMYVTNQDGSAAGYDYTFSYDAMGRFEKIYITNSAQLFQYYYDAASNEIERHNVYLNPAVNQVYPRDALNRMQYVDVTNGSTLGHEAYTYDPMNRITLVDYGNGHTDSFGYYLDGELNQAQLGNFNRNVTYNLDQAGNRTSVVDTGVTKSYAPNNLNQYTTGDSLSVTNGTEHQIQSFNKVTYNYINDEHLTQVSDGTNTYNPSYDALGRCVKRILTVAAGTSPLTNGATTYYVYDGEKPVLEYDASGSPVGFNLYGKGIDEILERGAYGSDNQWHWYFFQQNHEGSVTHLIDASGNVIERYRYDVFGAPTIYDGNWNVRQFTAYDNRFLFTGREYAATYRSIYNAQSFTFYEYRARAYNPALGRFMSEDPKLFDAGDYNLFRYCHNDPIDNVDPMGTQTDTQQNEPWFTHAQQAREIDLTIAERISLWQKSMETSLGGEQASLTLGGLRQTAKLETANPEASQLRPLSPWFPRTTKEFIAMGNAVEHGNTMDTSPAFDPIDILSGGIAGMARSAIGRGLAREGIEIAAQNGTKVTGFTAHGINRAIGDAAGRAGVKPGALLDALKNPRSINSGIDQLGRPYQIFTGENARVIVNPQTGQVISVNPTSAAGAH